MVDLREHIAREERVAGLRADGFVTRHAIQRRRLQIVLVSLLVLAGLVVTTVANDIWSDFRRHSWIDPELARVAMIVFSAAFAVYVLDKEQHLKRLSAMGHQVEELDLAVAERLLDAALLADTTRALTTTLSLVGVLSRLLEHAERLLDAPIGTVSLLTQGGELHEAAAHGPPCIGGRRLVAESIQVQVALAREPLLLSGPMPMELGDRLVDARRVASVLCVPLAHDEDVIGVLTVAAAPGRRFEARDVETASRLAATATAAIANARRHEAALVELGRAEELGPSPVDDEIGSHTIAIRDAVAALRIEALEATRRQALLDVVAERSAAILALVH